MNDMRKLIKKHHDLEVEDYKKCLEIERLNKIINRDTDTGYVLLTRDDNDIENNTKVKLGWRE